MVRHRSTWALTVVTSLLFLATGVAHSQSTQLDDYVLYAMDEIDFKGGMGPVGLSEINGGHVGVKAIDTNDPVLSIGVNHPVTVADGSQVVAHSMRINANTSVWDWYVNDIYGTGDPEVRHAGPTAFDASILPVVPDAPPCAPGTEDVVVEPGETLDLAPGAYGDVNPKDDSTLILHAGQYDFRTLLFGKRVTLVLESNTEIRVAERVALNDGYCVTGAGEEPLTDVKFWVCGDGQASDDTTFHFGKNGVFTGDVCVANGIIALGNGTQICGRVLGVKIRSDVGVTINPPEGCDCLTRVPVEPASWSRIKSEYR